MTPEGPDIVVNIGVASDGNPRRKHDEKVAAIRSHDADPAIREADFGNPALNSGHLWEFGEIDSRSRFEIDVEFPALERFEILSTNH